MLDAAQLSQAYKSIGFIGIVIAVYNMGNILII